MTDFLPIAVAIASLCGSAIAILTFWMKFSDRISGADTAARLAQATAEAAEEAAKEAKTHAHDTATTLAIQTAAFSLFREQVAKEYIHREVMREVETRLTDAINRLGDRLDKVLVKMGGS